jgi:hypothetical protein
VTGLLFRTENTIKREKEREEAEKIIKEDQGTGEGCVGWGREGGRGWVVKCKVTSLK